MHCTSVIARIHLAHQGNARDMLLEHTLDKKHNNLLNQQ
jgi:hypothetical protein